MTTEHLKHSYKEHLIKAGVEPQRASQAAMSLSIDDLRLIGEIWSEWGQVSQAIAPRSLVAHASRENG